MEEADVLLVAFDTLEKQIEDERVAIAYQEFVLADKINELNKLIEAKDSLGFRLVEMNLLSVTE